MSEELNLTDVTEDLGKHYFAWKEEEKEKNEFRDKFFALANEEVLKRGLPTFTGIVYGPSEEEAFARAKKYYPHAVVVQLDAGDDGYWKGVFESLPEFQPFTFVNKEDGRYYKRQVDAGSLELDDELLQQLDPELHARVTYIPGSEFFIGDPVMKLEFERAVEKSGTIKRELRDLNEINPNDLAKLAPYMYEGKPKVKLAAVRAAKPEELEDA